MKHVRRTSAADVEALVWIPELGSYAVFPEHPHFSAPLHGAKPSSIHSHPLGKHQLFTAAIQQEAYCNDVFQPMKE